MSHSGLKGLATESWARQVEFEFTRYLVITFSSARGFLEDLDTSHQLLQAVRSRDLNDGFIFIVHGNRDNIGTCTGTVGTDVIRLPFAVATTPGNLVGNLVVVDVLFPDGTFSSNRVLSYELIRSTRFDQGRLSLNGIAYLTFSAEGISRILHEVLGARNNLGLLGQLQGALLCSEAVGGGHRNRGGRRVR